MRKLCEVEGCSKAARSNKASMCPMHYHRQYRHGITDKPQVDSVNLGRRYTSTYMPDHPLAMRNGKVYTHRLALYEKLGPGVHACHWCSQPIQWLPKGMPHAINVDHLDNDGANNDPNNLVASCHPCNTHRGGMRTHAAYKEAGYWVKDTVGNLKPEGRRTFDA